jgi:hypothetical protein
MSLVVDLTYSHWVEEEMALRNVCEAFQHDGTSLEVLAKQIAKKERDRMEAIAFAIIKEFQLEYMLEESNVFGVLRSFSDLAKQVANQYVIEEVGAAELLERLILNDYVRLRGLAEVMVREENEELASSQVLDVGIYGMELHKHLRSLARGEIVSRLPRVCRWQTTGAWPNVLRVRLDLGATTARQEVLAKFVVQENGEIAVWGIGKPLYLEMNNPLYCWTATGRTKRYNRGYGPSRVDLGTKERYTTEQVFFFLSFFSFFFLIHNKTKKKTKQTAIAVDWPC